MIREKISIINLMRLSGTLCAFQMGAGIISGQESMQFYTSFGWFGLLGLLLNVGGLWVIAYTFSLLANERRMEDPYQALNVVLGPKVGKFYSYISLLIFIIGLFMMSAGAGATASEFFGISNRLGRLIVILPAAIVVYFGLDRILQILSFVGPVNLILMIVAMVVSIVKAPLGVTEGMAYVASAEIYRGAPFWWLAAIKNSASGMIACIPIFVVCGLKANNQREAKISSVTMFFPYLIVMSLISIAQAMNIKEIMGVEIPIAIMTGEHMTSVSWVYGLSIILGSFACIVVELWSLVRRIALEGTKVYKLWTIVIAILTYIISGIFPFSKIMNYNYTIFLTFGILLFIMVVVRTWKKRRN